MTVPDARASRTVLSLEAALSNVVASSPSSWITISMAALEVLCLRAVNNGPSRVRERHGGDTYPSGLVSGWPESPRRSRSTFTREVGTLRFADHTLLVTEDPGATASARDDKAEPDDWEKDTPKHGPRSMSLSLSKSQCLIMGGILSMLWAGTQPWAMLLELHSPLEADRVEDGIAYGCELYN